MAAPSSAGCPDPPAAARRRLRRLFCLYQTPRPCPRTPPLPSHFSPQSILGRPPNPSHGPPQGILYTVGGAGRGNPPRPAGGGRGHSAPPHAVTVANPAGYVRNNSPTAVVTFPAAAVQARPLGFPSDHGYRCITIISVSNVSSFPLVTSNHELSTLKEFRPLPLKAAEPTSSGKRVVDVKDDDPQREENGDSVDQLSAHDLLQRHVKRARRVRACLKEERFQRIERYKQRLALLLPVPPDLEKSPGA
ncbi:unnamed protein product [Spirodela intermedia]|uniref:Uncharacterized protein n=1 Tax=Spirodela intermedia TaxID=51605 RepID=A0A7I8J388_SPIIN|nr:unnamed protein product [Spirodela intermedia]CAA6664706.1 unnamed protein product [Spirodela intermedia]